MGHGLGCTCRRCRNRQALGEDEARLWGCALVAGLVVAVIIGIVAGIAALVGAFSTHTPTAPPTGAARQADDTICFQFIYSVMNTGMISQAQHAASPQLAALVTQWNADGGLGIGDAAADIPAIISWCNNHGLAQP
jgi:hypothetical protein